MGDFRIADPFHRTSEPMLAARSGLTGHLIAAFCAADITGRQVVCLVRARRYRRKSGWTAAAAVHAASLPGRVPAPTLAAASRYLPVIASARRHGRAWLYVAPCPGPALPCTMFCEVAGSAPLGGHVLVLLGQHVAELPDVAAAALAHETAHYAGPARRVLVTARHVRETGSWGYAAAGLAGQALAGWPGAAAAGVVFHVLSILALWMAETWCDLAAARAEGWPASLAGFAYMETRFRAAAPAGRAGRVAAAVLDWAAGPLHPPVRLRRTLTRTLTGPDTSQGHVAAAIAVPDPSTPNTIR